jgi:hypothetical protein
MFSIPSIREQIQQLGVTQHSNAESTPSHGSKFAPSIGPFNPLTSDFSFHSEDNQLDVRISKKQEHKDRQGGAQC